MKKFLAVFFFLVFVVSVQAEETPVPGTGLALNVPDGFTVADGFRGFISEKTGASIMIVDLPAPAEEVIAGFTPEALAEKGMKFLSREDAIFGNLKGVLIQVSQPANGQVYKKWQGIFGAQEKTYFVLGVYPEGQEDMKDILKKAVLSVHPTGDKRAGGDNLTFSIDETKQLKIAKKFGNNVILTGGGVFPAKSMDIPLVVAGVSLSPLPAGTNQKVYAKRKFDTIEGLKDHQAQAIEAITIDNLSGYSVTGKARDGKEGVLLKVYQVILFEPAGYYIIQATVAEAVAAQYWSEFKQVAASFKRKQ